MEITEEICLRALARMFNNLDYRHIEPFINDEFVYESQVVYSAITGQVEFRDYILGKFETIKRSRSVLKAEMGTINLYGEDRSCLLLHQDGKKICFVLAETNGDYVNRFDLCVVPSPSTVKGTGEFPR